MQGQGFTYEISLGDYTTSISIRSFNFAVKYIRSTTDLCKVFEGHMTSNAQEDKWGPSLSTVSPDIQSDVKAGAVEPVSNSQSGYSSIRHFVEDPVYLAALDQALKTSTLGSTLPANILKPASNHPPITYPTPAKSLPLQPTPKQTLQRGQTGSSSQGDFQAKQPSKTNPPLADIPAQGKANSSGGSSKTEASKQDTPKGVRSSLKHMKISSELSMAGKEQSIKEKSLPSDKANRRPEEDPRGSVGVDALKDRTRTIPVRKVPVAEGQLQRDMKHGHLFRGRLRVNAGEPREAFVTVSGLPNDLMLRGIENRGNAMEGDEVAVRVLPVHRWFTQQKGGAAAGSSGRPVATGSGEPWLSSKAGPEAACAEIRKLLETMPGTRATAQAVAVLEPGLRREQLVGVLQAERCKDNKDVVVYLLPMDPRLPKCQLSATSARSLPEGLLDEALGNTSVESRTLVSARVVEWFPGHELPTAELRASLGQAGEVESETAAILDMEGIRRGDFDEEVLACLPKTPWMVGSQHEAGRADFRKHRIFSIDPPTAKDLDDALSIEKLENGNFKVGVHIADVACFIPPRSALDIEAGLRATSVYLVQRVIPMLPPLLCEELCSLNPGVERFAFSVVWELDPQGVVLSQWFGRSLICSCAKLTYPIVQQMIEGTFCAEDVQSSIPLHGGFTWEQVVEDSLALNAIARHLRRSRFDNGALRLDNTKLFFKLDKDGNPVSTSQYIQKESNQLVEEFMLLTNTSVAQMISSAFPNLAILRRHDQPDAHKMAELLSVAQDNDIPVDATSAAALQTSLAQLRSSDMDSDLIEVFTMLATRPMQLATYFCTGQIPDPSGWGHYALAVGAYTHFTSPIRRYPDVVVHRLLAAALDMQSNGLSEEETVAKHMLFETILCGKVAKHCNEKRLTARKAQDASLRMYLCCLLRRKPIVTQGILLQVGGEKYFNVYCPEYGVDCRIYVEHIGLPCKANWNAGAKTLILEPAERGQQQVQGQGNRHVQKRYNGRESSTGSCSVPSLLDRGLDPCSTDFCYDRWIQHLASGSTGGISNIRKLRPVALPLQLKALIKVPVVLCSPLRPGKISEVVARLYLGEPPVAEQSIDMRSEEVCADIEVEESQYNTFQIPYESTLND
ncbi:hypothetical protein CEUSTIGMA_g11784.t1 [Chlamydomonas eustigma]|uniref:RNB domain-containing protein n=1 Tax=Chlamydomonas eustigma TaxID=1157962 RepID=A0A250XN72_9CHLO|nr:hypothetical protein CEUSTIGMA_g11784.t1 [Chlamydomonas eustigma]|eukprot:GAX84362.1 hypothetical protein CEUSTIGMA_g11784.t1 [Chlamydomonas eustigma]